MTLPATWQTAPIGELLLDVEKGEPSMWHKESFFYVDIASIDSEAMRVSSPSEIKVDEAPSRAKQHLKVGDVVFSTVRPYLKNIGLIEKCLDGHVASTGLCVLRAIEAVSYKYLYYFVSSDGYIKGLKPLQRGTSYPAVRDADVKSMSIPLPPANEQLRIVAKIETLFSEIDHGVEELKAAQKKLKRARQALLKAAFEGKLTARWRTENPDKLESPEVLRQRIQTEREAYHRRQLEQWEKAVEAWKASGSEGRKPRKPKTLTSFKDVSEEELPKLPEIPEGWIFVRLEFLGELARGKSKHRPRNDPKLYGGEYPFVQTGDVRAAKKVIDSYSSTYNEEGLAQSKLWPKGTLCITVAANIAETGFLGMKACFPDSVVGFSPSRLVSSEYVEAFISSARERISAYAPATAQKNINLKTLESLIVPYCSYEEQREIVQKLGASLSHLDKLEDVFESSWQRAESLKQSILKQAFSGRLVPQDPDDEPASELLARIRAEREVQQQAAPRRRRRKPAEEATP